VRGHYQLSSPDRIAVVIGPGLWLLIHSARSYQHRHQRKSEHLLNTKCTYLFCGSGSPKNAINVGHTATATATAGSAANAATATAAPRLT